MTDGNTEKSEVTSLLVRSTIHLPDIGSNAVVYVDPRVPYVAGCLDRGFLIPVGEEPLEVTAPEQEEDSRVEAELEDASLGNDAADDAD